MRLCAPCIDGGGTESARCVSHDSRTRQAIETGHQEAQTTQKGCEFGLRLRFLCLFAANPFSSIGLELKRPTDSPCTNHHCGLAVLFINTLLFEGPCLERWRHGVRQMRAICAILEERRAQDFHRASGTPGDYFRGVRSTVQARSWLSRTDTWLSEE